MEYHHDSIMYERGSGDGGGGRKGVGGGTRVNKTINNLSSRRVFATSGTE